LVRWRAIDARRSAESRAAELMEDGKEIRFVVNRMNDGQPLTEKIRSAWEGIIEDAGLGEGVVRHSLHHAAATWHRHRSVGSCRMVGMAVEQLEQNYGHHTSRRQRRSSQGRR
jgi:hypothetical protein